MDSAIEIRDEPDAGRIDAFEDGAAIGVLAYFRLDGPGEALVAVHTAVDGEHQGRGIAGALVRELHAKAAREEVPVVALCPYTAQWARRHPSEARPASEEAVRAAREQLAADPDRW